MSAENSVAAPNILTPVQWYAGIHRENPRFHGIKQLMLAVLTDALWCLQTGTRTDIQRRSLAEAEAWIADRKAQGPFAFETVCETLEINPDWLRESLREWRRHRLSGNNSHCQLRRVRTTRSGKIGSSVRRRRRKANEVAVASQQG